MPKTISKFVLQRRRDLRQPRQQIVEEGGTGDVPIHPEIPQQIAEPQPEEPSAQPVWGKVRAEICDPNGYRIELRQWFR